MVLSCHPGLILDTIVLCDFGWREVAEVAVQSLFVEPGHPPTRGDLETIELLPVSPPLPASTARLRCSSVLKMPMTDSAITVERIIDGANRRCGIDLVNSVDVENRRDLLVSRRPCDVSSSPGSCGTSSRRPC